MHTLLLIKPETYSITKGDSDYREVRPLGPDGADHTEKAQGMKTPARGVGS